MRSTLIIAAVIAAVTIEIPAAHAHCDTLDDRVITAGQQALDAGSLELALVWVKPDADVELRAAFQHALAVRLLGAKARELADRYFLETLVRHHRAAEGALHTAPRPEVTDVEPAIRAAGDALGTGSPKAVYGLLAGPPGAICGAAACIHGFMLYLVISALAMIALIRSRRGPPR